MENIENIEEPKPICPNCEKKMPRKGKFCPNCGQKAFDGRVSMSELIWRFARNVIHLDGKFIHTFWEMLKPGKVSTDYFQGKMRRYVHPVQFFFIVMFFFILCLSKCQDLTKDGAVKLNLRNNTVVSDSLSKSFSGESLMEAIRFYGTGVELREKYEALPDSLKNDAARRTIEAISDGYTSIVYGSLLQMDSTRLEKSVDSLPINIGTHQIMISISDIARTSPEEIVKKYNITVWYDKLLVKQSLKTLRDTKGLMRSYLSSLTWTILALTGFLALVLFVLFRRQRSYYVEHFIFLMHYLSAVLLLATLVLAIHIWIFPLPPAISGLIFLWAGIAMFLGMRQFYGTSVVRTLVYQLIFSILGFMGFVLFFMLGMLVVLAFF
jgi:hypothetical protein